jgi:hypothetical protein
MKVAIATGETLHIDGGQTAGHRRNGTHIKGEGP